MIFIIPFFILLMMTEHVHTEPLNITLLESSNYAPAMVNLASEIMTHDPDLNLLPTLLQTPTLYDHSGKMNTFCGYRQIFCMQVHGNFTLNFLL